jgi:hypothetical protein
MKHWEYKKIEEYQGVGQRAPQDVTWDEVEQAGLHGWELVSVLQNKWGEIYFFKREIA